MSKEVLAAISRTYELTSYSTPELRSLFNDWLTEIERMVVSFVDERKNADPDEIAHHLKLKRDSIIFILSKLAREGMVSMKATGNVTRKIRPLKGKKC